jgi:hypothetical protein
MILLIQLPRTFYFSSLAVDQSNTVNRTEEDVLLELGQLLYPDHKTIVQKAFLALREPDPAIVKSSLDGIASLLENSSAVRLGLLGRFVFPSPMAIADNLQLQLETRFARQSLVHGLQRDSSVAAATKLVEQYFDKLLTWNEATGWAKMLNIVRLTIFCRPALSRLHVLLAMPCQHKRCLQTIWRKPIYEVGGDFNGMIFNLKEALAEGAPYTRYAQIAGFFSGIAARLSDKYGDDAAMVGCVEPFKYAVIQAEGKDQGQG